MKKDKEFFTAFWVIIPGIFIFQIFALILSVLYGFEAKGRSKDFNLFFDSGSIIWVIILTIVSLIILKSRKLKIIPLFNITFNALKASLPTLAKYSLVCMAGVGILSFLKKGTELQFEYRSGFGILVTIFITVILAPIGEEIIFRGFLQTSMIKTFKGKLERVLVNALFFSAAHVFFIELIFSRRVPIYIFILGFLLAKLYEEYKSLLPCILLHFINNFLVMVVDYIKYTNI